MKYFLNFINKNAKDLKMALIPTAGYPVIKEKYVKQIIENASQYRIKTKVIDLKKENSKTLELKLKDIDIVYVNGGNSFWLLKLIRKSGFNKIIQKLVSEGKIYIGISAGIYVACPTIEMAKWKHLDDPQVAKESDLTALSLVNFLITAHYEDKYQKQSKMGQKQPRCRL